MCFADHLNSLFFIVPIASFCFYLALLYSILTHQKEFPPPLPGYKIFKNFLPPFPPARL